MFQERVEDGQHIAARRRSLVQDDDCAPVHVPTHPPGRPPRGRHLRIPRVDRSEHATVALPPYDADLRRTDEARAGAHEATVRAEAGEEVMRLRQRVLELVIRETRRPLVPPQVVGDLVALVEDAAHQRRMPPGARSDQEERRAGAMARQHVEHLRREGGVRPVVEGQRVQRLVGDRGEDDVGTSPRRGARDQGRRAAVRSTRGRREFRPHGSRGVDALPAPASTFRRPSSMTSGTCEDPSRRSMPPELPGHRARERA